MDHLGSNLHTGGTVTLFLYHNFGRPIHIFHEDLYISFRPSNYFRITLVKDVKLECEPHK